MLFGEVILRLRRERGWTLEKLAKKVGVVHACISAIERCEVDQPRHNTMTALARAFDISYNEFMIITMNKEAFLEIKDDIIRGQMYALHRTLIKKHLEKDIKWCEAEPNLNKDQLEYLGKRVKNGKEKAI